MSRNRPKILIGTMVATFGGFVLALLFFPSTTGYVVYIGTPLLLGSVLALLADD